MSGRTPSHAPERSAETAQGEPQNSNLDLFGLANSTGGLSRFRSLLGETRCDRSSGRRRQFLAASVLSASVLLGGCSLLKKSEGEDSGVSKLLNAPEPPELIRQAASPRGLNPVRVSGVGLVNSLPKTGGPADPSPFRDMLLEEMRRNDVPGANDILESDTNALVRVYATIPPAAKRGDLLDVTIDSPAGTNVTDLHGGWLLDTRLRLEQLIQGRVRKGDLQGVATGAVLTRAATKNTSDERLKSQGVILGGATVQKSRNMGLVIRPEYQHVKVATEIAEAINRRFFFFDGTTRRGVAKAIEDDYVEVELHPRYEASLPRYISVIQGIVIDGREASSQARLVKLAERLNDPATAADAAVQLEALGESAIPTLIAGTKSDNPELRFYAGEALAYLDRSEAIPVLEQSIIGEAAFRHPSLAALEGLGHPAVGEALLRLMHQPSVEVRYGAYVALRKRGDVGSLLPRQLLGKALEYCQVDSAAEPALVLSLRDQPELVVFGNPSPVRVQAAVLGPAGLIVKPDPANPTRLRISRFTVGAEDRRTTQPATIRGLVDGIVAVGGDYGDVVAVMRLAKTKGCIRDQLVMDPLPKALRTYYRDDESE